MTPRREVKTLSDLARAQQPVGPRIGIARENMGMTVEELAAHLGVTPASVAAWEAGERAPRSNRLQMLAGILNVSITWLLEGREDERMAAGGSPTLEDVQARLESARALLSEGLALVASAQVALADLALEERSPDGPDAGG